MRPGRLTNENFKENPEPATFVKDNIENPSEIAKSKLPSSVYPTFSRHFGNEHKMNSPGDMGDQSSAFAGMYETDANYRWRKVRGNLDLFVMERNERHLTSLQWKWQKMPKARRRTPVYENQESNYTPYWPGRSRYLPNQPPREPAYPSYDYVPDFPNQYRPAYPHQPPAEYPSQYHQMAHQDANMSAMHMYPNQRDVDPWMKKDMSPQQYVKNFYEEEELKLEEQRRKNEEATKRLQNEQQEMEMELHNLRKMLNAEMRRQEDTNCINEHFNDKIENIERQIAVMDSKLSDTAGRLKHNELEKEQLFNKLSCIKEGDIPLNAPLFIIADPENGTAAALAQGSFQDYDQELSTRGSSIVPRYESSHFNNSRIFPYSIPSNSEEQSQQQLQQQRQQEHLKAELEHQMATLKAELEHQLQEQNSRTESNTNDVIDVRVTNLEKQIEEMSKQIRQAETEIKKVETERKTKEEKKSPEMNEKNQKAKPKDEVKKIIHNLSVSPKVTPMQSRRKEESEENNSFHKRAINDERISPNKGRQANEEMKLKTIPSEKHKTPKPTKSHGDSHKASDFMFKKQAFKTSSMNDPKALSPSATKSTSSVFTNDDLSQGGDRVSRFKSRSKNLSPTDREATLTTLGSDFSQLHEEELSQIQSTTTYSGPRAESGWNGSKQSLLYGLGTDWCVCPKQIWKHFGDDTDEEPITRRKCISVIMGSILAFLLLAVVIGLIIGIVNSQASPESPIRFVVIPGENGGGDSK